MFNQLVRRLLWHIRTICFSPPGPRRYLMSENPKYRKFNIGKHSYGKPNIFFANEQSSLTIGKYTSIADDVVIMLGGEHRLDWMTTYPLSLYYPEWAKIKGHPATKGDVVIGNDVWIGREAMILSGVTIGDGAVIGARSLVTKNVMPYSIVGGNPAKPIKFRFANDVIETLEKIAWWDWPENLIREATPYLLSNDIAALNRFFESRVLPSNQPQI